MQVVATAPGVSKRSVLHPARHPIYWIIAIGLVVWGIFYQLSVVVPDRSRLVSDSAYYGHVARHLARGDGYVETYSRPVQIGVLGIGPPSACTFWSPTYPALTAIGFEIAGGFRDWVPIAANAIGYLVAISALYGLGRRVLGGRIGWIPAAVMALDAHTMTLATDGLTEGWYTAFLLLTMTQLLRPDRTPVHLVGAGLSFALLILTRLNGLAFLPVILVLVLTNRPRGRALFAFFAPMIGLLSPWIALRILSFGSPFFELQRYNLLHDLGPWVGNTAFRTPAAPSPLAYMLQHPVEVLEKVGLGLVKGIGLLGLRTVEPLEALFIGWGCVVMLMSSRYRRRPPNHYSTRWLLGVVVGMITCQLLMSSVSLLEPRLWIPVTVFLWIPLAVGVGDLARRITITRRRTAAVLLVAACAVPPLGRSLTLPASDRWAAQARFTEFEARRLGDWIQVHVPPAGVILTDVEAMMWYADRPIVWRPVDVEELDPIRSRVPIPYVLWQLEPDRDLEDESWNEHLKASLHAAKLRMLGTIELEDERRFALARWLE